VIVVKLYRTRLNLGSASLSHWQADTVFGHLCWSLVRRRGESALREFLARFEGEDRDPPVLVSDGFPDAYLPRPLHLPAWAAGAGLAAPSAPAAAVSKLQRIQSAQQRKQQAGANWLTIEDFNRARNGLAPEHALTDAGIAQSLHIHVQPKNQIDRLTGTTGADAGQLYELTEIVMPIVTLYWKIADGHLGVVRDFLDDLAMSGYGKRKTIGYGQLSAPVALEAFDGFEEVSGAGGFVTLSRFIPHRGDPAEGVWETVVKYGKLGEEFAVSGSPFKKPLIQMTRGSCFRDASPREWYGRMIEGVSTIDAVRHYAFAFALPMRWEN
jgi:CRISPR-associated protein Csm4